MNKTKIYIAGPFFNATEKENLAEMINYIKSYFPDAELFIPMEHIVPGGNDKDENGNYIMPNNIWGKKVFEMDIDGMSDCDMLVAYYDGHYSDTGTAWEMGYAYAKGIPVYVWIPDTVDVTSCMVMNGCYKVLSNKINEQK